ncbi:MAG: hypothetical protein KY464_01945 [Gemmatimonadetes bacterium]|nr:hypothetical protein [Gemmatimonadota bacterium]
MVRKKMEGDENQKKQKAREARAEGKSASEVGATTGGSKQRDRKDNEKGKPDGNRGRAEHDQQPVTR